MKKGECFGFLGPNRVGKPTIVRMIHCVSPLSAGILLVNGMPVKLIEDEIGREVAEIRIFPDQDDRLINLFLPFSCRHERVGDTLYFYCWDGQELTAVGSDKLF